MSPVTKATRCAFWKSKVFQGSIDWVVNLWSYHPEDTYGLDTGGIEFNGDTTSLAPCTGSYSTLDDLEKNKDVLAATCRDQYMIEIL